MATRPSGLKAPSKIGKPGGIPRPGSLQTGVKVEDAVANSARAAGMRPSDANQHADKTVRTVNNSGNSSNHADEYIIGDRVIVGGNKHGRIQFLGETQFASGQWAGVVLDEAIGKNDGSVNGVRYFQCESKKGVFARADKLVRESAGHVDSRAAVGGIARHVPSTPRMGTKVSSPRSSISKPPGSKPGLIMDEKQDPVGLKGGDRVLVSGSKLGTLRYIGTTEFAKGEWAGVELDEEQGKNDGAVAGTRYFQCKPKHGLFAPVHKVSKVRGKGAVPPGQRRQSSSANTTTTDGLSQGRLSHSSSSISSLGSGSNASSSLSRGLAISSGDLGGSSPRGSVDSSKKSQLLEHELVVLRAQHQQYVRENEETVESLKELVETGDKEKVELMQKLEETQRQVDDLQFRIAEATITSSEIQEEHESESQKLKALTSKLDAEVKKTSSLNAEILDFKSQNEEKEFKIAELEMEASTYTEQLEELQQELKEVKQKAEDLETRSKEGEKTGEEVEVQRRKVGELEVELEAVRRSKEELEKRVEGLGSELRNEIDQKQERDNEIAELNKRVAEEESARTKLAFDVQGLKNALSDFERKWQASEERCKQLVEDKTKLETDISELMKNSGNSSEQLVLLNEQIRTKDRRIEELQSGLSEANQSVARLTDLLSQAKAEAEEENRQQLQKHQAELQKTRQQMNSLQVELQTSESERSGVQEEMKQQLDAVQQRLEAEVATLRKEKEEIESEKKRVDSSIQELQSQANETQQRLQAHEEEKTTMATSLQQTAEERDRLREERDQALAEQQQLISARAELSLRQDEADLKQRQIQELLDRESQAKIDAIKTTEEAKASVDRVTQERDSALRERTEALAQAQQRQIQLETRSQEAETLRRERGEAQERVSRLEEAEKEAETKREEARARLETLEKELDEARRERTELAAREQETRIKVETKDKELEGLKKELERQRDKEEMLAKASKEGEQSVTDLQTQLIERGQDLEASKGQVAELQQKSSSLQTKVEEMQKQSEEKLQQMELTMSDLRASLDTVTKEKESLNTEQSSLGSKLTAKDQECGKLKEQVSSLEEQVKTYQTQLTSIESSVSNEKAASSDERTKLSERVTEKEAECSRLQDEVTELRSKVKEQETAREEERARLGGEVEEKEAENARLLEEVGSLKQQVESYQTQMNIAKDTASQEENSVGVLKAELAEARHALKMEQATVSKLETEKSNIQQDITALQVAQKEKEQLQHKNQSLENELQTTKDDLESRLGDLETERDTLQNALEFTNSLVAQHQHEVEKLQEVARYQEESTLASSYKATIKDLEGDKTSLQQQVSDLQAALVSAQSTSAANIDVDVDGDPAMAKMQEEREMAEGQVTFLNSVIVDLQRKNDELRAKLEAMEMGYMNGDHSDIGFDVDLDPNTHGPPPRLFCDICDVFDLHDTEDCPLQASSDSPPATQYHGNMLEERPYCDICEVFGHWTENCDDEQTY